MRRDSTDSDREAITEREGDVTATLDGADRGTDTPDDEETLACPADGADPDPTTSEFVWCETAASPTESESEIESGFEWCDPEDDRRQRSRPEPRGTDPDTDAAADEGPTGPALDPEVVTTTRMRGIDDEAVALLSTLRRHGESRRTESTGEE